jgi:type I site-specific restriction-modification system R (restriction) subunit
MIGALCLLGLFFVHQENVNNKRATNRRSPANGFLAKCTLGKMISRYRVRVQSEKKLMMRPHQIYAVKATSLTAFIKTVTTAIFGTPQAQIKH